MSKAPNLNVSNPNVLIGLSLCLVLLGAMIMDPLAGSVCLTLAGILTTAALIKGRKWSRYAALALLAFIIVLAAQKFPEAYRHWNIIQRK